MSNERAFISEAGRANKAPLDGAAVTQVAVRPSSLSRRPAVRHEGATEELRARRRRQSSRHARRPSAGRPGCARTGRRQALARPHQDARVKLKHGRKKPRRIHDTLRDSCSESAAALEVPMYAPDEWTRRLEAYARSFDVPRPIRSESRRVLQEPEHVTDVPRRGPDAAR